MFEKIAPYLKDPLILIGFFLFVSFLFLRSWVVRGLIPTLAQGQGFKILKIILLYGFIIGIALVGLGFGLKYKELIHRAEKNISPKANNIETGGGDIDIKNGGIIQGSQNEIMINDSSEKDKPKKK